MPSGRGWSRWGREAFSDFFGGAKGEESRELVINVFEDDGRDFDPLLPFLFRGCRLSVNIITLLDVIISENTQQRSQQQRTIQRVSSC